MDEQELKESIKVLLSKAPKPVQSFILDRLSDFSIDMIAEYALHIDQGAVLEQELLLMLLGQESPADFSKNLQQAGIPGDDVRSILEDVNEKVFKPLQQEELSRVDTPKPAYRSVPERPVVQAPQITASPTQTPPAASPQPKAPSVEIPPFNLVRPDVLVPAQTLPPAVQMRTMQHDIQVLQDPNTPPLTVPNMPHPSQVTPARSFQTASVPFTSIPSAPQPTPVPHQVINPPKPAPAALPPQSAPQAPVMKEHGGDPYREPI